MGSPPHPNVVGSPESRFRASNDGEGLIRARRSLALPETELHPRASAVIEDGDRKVSYAGARVQSAA